MLDDKDDGEIPCGGSGGKGPLVWWAKLALGLLFFVMVLGMSMFFFQVFLAFFELLSD